MLDDKLKLLPRHRRAPASKALDRAVRAHGAQRVVDWVTAARQCRAAAAKARAYRGPRGKDVRDSDYPRRGRGGVESRRPNDASALARPTAADGSNSEPRRRRDPVSTD